jgi:hypothetical protein
MATTGTIHLDTVEGSQLTVTGTAARMYRGFTIEGIDATALPDASVMLVARDLALSSGGSTYPGAPNYNLTDVIIRGISSDAVQGQLVYETFAGLEPSVYIVRDASFSQERRVCFSPVDGTLFSVDFKNTDGDVVIGEDVAHVILDWPMRAINVTATRFGRPPIGLGRSVPSVNDTPWPTEDPLAKGMWKVTSVVSTTNRIAGYYTYQAMAITRTTDPWHEMVVLQSKLTGRYAKVNPSEFSGEFGLPYSFGVSRKNGFQRICPFPEVDIAGLLPI